MCFTTEEKLSRGGGSGNKRRRKSGSLSQRLRLSESCEDQSSSSDALETMSGLVLRPSTCPPGSPPPESPTLTDRPSSFTLSSLNDDQLNAYLKIMFKRCIKEEQSHVTQRADEDGSDVVASSVEQLESASASAAPVTAAEELGGAASQTTAAEARLRKPTLSECEELLRRHEQLFGPIVTSRRAPLSHWLPQPAAALPEPCQPPPGSECATSLSIPQHGDTGTARDHQWDAWRRHFSSGPDGVWRIVAHDASSAAVEPAAEAAPSANAKSKRLFSALRHKCSALFYPEQKPRAPAAAAAGDRPRDSGATGVGGEECADEVDEKTLSEINSEEVLKGMNEDDVVPCTTSEDLAVVSRHPRHDPEVYREGGPFGAWGGFFGWSSVEPPAVELPSPDRPRPSGAATSEMTFPGEYPSPTWTPCSSV